MIVSKSFKIVKGLSLIELMVTLVIMFIVGMGVYRSLCSGIALGKWYMQYRPLGEVFLFWEKLADDLRNYCPMADFDFKGNTRQLVFFVHKSDYLSANLSSLMNMEKPSIYKVEYTFYPAQKEVRRKLYQFGSKHPFEDICVISDIESMRFTFYFFDKSSKTKVVKYLTENTPQMIGVEMEWYTSYKEKKKVSKIIPIPYLF